MFTHFQPVCVQPSVISTASFYPPQHRNGNSVLSSNYTAPTSDSRRLSSQYVRSTKTLLLENNNSSMQVGLQSP